MRPKFKDMFDFVNDTNMHYELKNENLSTLLVRSWLPIKPENKQICQLDSTIKS